MFTHKSLASPTVYVNPLLSCVAPLLPNKGVFKDKFGPQKAEPHIADVVLDRITCTYNPTLNEVHEVEDNLSQMPWYGRKLKSPEFVPGPDVMRPFGTSLRHRGVAFRQ